jgi:hypothetical protein
MTAAPIWPGEVKNTPVMTTAALRWDANFILVGRRRFIPNLFPSPSHRLGFIALTAFYKARRNERAPEARRQSRAKRENLIVRKEL